MMLELSEWRMRANLLSYFWSRVHEEGWFRSDDPNIEWEFRSDDKSPIPALSWFDPYLV